MNHLGTHAVYSLARENPDIANSTSCTRRLNLVFLQDPTDHERGYLKSSHIHRHKGHRVVPEDVDDFDGNGVTARFGIGVSDGF